MKQVLSFVTVFAGMSIVLAALPKDTLAADKANYSGKYSAERNKNASSGSTDSILEVVQNEDSIEITKVELGKRTSSRCPLNGSEGDYTSPSGVPGKCKAQLKEKYLILESVVVTRPQPTAAMRVHTKERWQLSVDAKTLTVKFEVDFPDVSRDVSATVAGDFSETRKYTRTDGH